METGQEKNKGFFQEQTEKIITKVEKTPMEKFFVFFLVLISISAVILGYLQFNKNITGPALETYINRKRSEMMEKYKPSTAATEEEQINRLRNQDSDLDGLDDWSELNVYGTSPYLSDSDNDRLSDREEVIKGTNPNCPEGLNCTVLEPVGEIAGSEGTNINSIIRTLGESDLQTIMEYEQKLISGEVTLAELGINNPELQKLFDQLRTMPRGSIANINSQDKSQALEMLKNMTPAQLRQELLNRGMDEATLNQIDDETLIQMLNQLIATYK